MPRSGVDRWIVPAAAAEAAVTGIFVIVSPALFAWLVLGAELGSPGEMIGRLGAIALLGTALATWSSPRETHPAASLRALLLYNLLLTIYLAYLGFGGRSTGVLLWPAIGLHAILTALLAWSYRGRKRTGPPL